MSNFLIPKNEINLQTEILIADVIEDFLLTKNSSQTVRSYRNDLLSFFNRMELIFLNELAQVQFSLMVDHVMSFIRSQEKKDPFTDKVKNPSTVKLMLYPLFLTI